MSKRVTRCVNAIDVSRRVKVCSQKEAFKELVYLRSSLVRIDIMSSFIHLPDYRIAVCKECKIGVSIEGINAHLMGKKHEKVPAKERRRIITELGQIPGIIQNQQGLRDFQFPIPSTKAIPELGEPKRDGIRCKKCSYVGRQRQGIQGHCRSEHGWKNPWPKGRESLVKKQERKEKDLPWVYGISCQRFFDQGVGSRWFEVDRGQDVVQEADGEDMKSRVDKATQVGLARVAKKNKSIIQGWDEKKEPDLWLRRVKWVEHLESYDRTQLLTSIAPIDITKELVLNGIWESFQRVFHAAQQTVVFGDVGQAALFEVNRKEQGVKAKKPFDQAGR